MRGVRTTDGNRAIVRVLDVEERKDALTYFRMRVVTGEILLSVEATPIPKVARGGKVRQPAIRSKKDAPRTADTVAGRSRESP